MFVNFTYIVLASAPINGLPKLLLAKLVLSTIYFRKIMAAFPFYNRQNNNPM